MSYTVAPESFANVRDPWAELLPESATNTVFVTPQWQELWWKHFGGGRELEVLAVRDGTGALVAVAPLLLNGRKISLVGNTDVCDYLDVVLARDHAQGALAALVDVLGSRCWERLVLHSIPAGSPTLELLPAMARERAWEVAVTQENVCPRVELPEEWEAYLAGLSKKDRHELRRKFRRLDAAGEVRFVRSDGGAAVDSNMDDFFRLHRLSREDKAEFMTPHMEEFFRQLVSALAPEGKMSLSFLEVDGVRAAAVIYFDYNRRRLLYNSGYDPAFASLSVGLLLKAHALREAIETGMECFDFLRGDEAYKYDLGGTDYSIYQCVVTR